MKSLKRHRRGAILILIAGMIVGLVVLTAVLVDIGYLAMTKTQLQSAADSSALAGGMELSKGLGPSPQMTPTQATATATNFAVDYASRNRAAEQPSVVVNGSRDVRFGNARFVNGAWQQSWGTQPYNMIGVSALRNQTGSGADGPLPLFFSGFMGATANLSVTASAALMPATSFRITPGSNITATLIPFAIDINSWNALLAGTGPDVFNYNQSTGQVSSGSDGYKEADMYPNSSFLTSGNNGTIDLGNGNNSTTDLTRQITNGMNANDFSYYPNNTISASSSQPFTTTGDTGISSGMKSALEGIKGQARTMAVYSSAVNPGNNATYTVVKFVGIRIVDVKLTGNPKHVWVQQATVVDPTGVGDITATITSDTVFAPIMLIQ